MIADTSLESSPLSTEVGAPANVLAGASGSNHKPARPFTGLGRALDWLERVLVLAFYAWLVFRIIRSYTLHGGAADLLLLPSEGLVVLFLLVRRPATAISRRPGDWLAALAATCAALLVSPVPDRALVPVQFAAAALLT